MSEPTPGEIVIAIDHPKNSNVFFFPVNDLVRSHFYPSRSGAGAPEVLTKYMIQGIPGQRIHIDVKAKRARITDALGDKANERFLKTLKDECSRSAKPMHCGDPVKDAVYENLTPEDIQTWLYWMRRMVDGGWRDPETRDVQPTAKLVQGALPDLDTVVATGKARRPKYHGREGNKSLYYEAPKTEELAGASR